MINTENDLERLVARMAAIGVTDGYEIREEHGTLVVYLDKQDIGSLAYLVTRNDEQFRMTVERVRRA